MQIAVISDLHANKVALDAVLEQLAKLSFERLICLGDLVGYGAEPQAVIQRVRAVADVVVKGNHDRDTVQPQPTTGTHSLARLTQEWTRQQLDRASLDYLAQLPHRAIEPYGLIAVHGCYLNDDHTTGYVTSTMVPENLQAVARRPEWPKLALCGHTHVPMCGWLRGDDHVERPGVGEVVWPPNPDAVLINPGAVGQPRDGDPRAAFALIDLARRAVNFYRVPYDLERAAQTILAAGLPPALADRLHRGI